MDSILISIKKMLGITPDYTYFDTDLIIHINSVLAILTQIGVGSSEGFAIEDSTETWEDFVDDEKTIQFVKSYVYLKVKMLFDPSLSSAVIESSKGLINELEWRLMVAVDPDEDDDE